MYKETLIVSLGVFVTFQVKFQVYTPQKNWSLSSPPSKMLLPRMDSLDRSTTTSPTVSTVYLLTTWTFCASFIIFVAYLSFWFSGERFPTCVISVVSDSVPLLPCCALLYVLQK